MIKCCYGFGNGTKIDNSEKCIDEREKNYTHEIVMALQ